MGGYDRAELGALLEHNEQRAGWVLHQLLRHVEKLTAEDFADDLKIIMGHTPLQVLMGALLGVAVGMLL